MKDEFSAAENGEAWSRDGNVAVDARDWIEAWTKCMKGQQIVSAVPSTCC